MVSLQLQHSILPSIPHTFLPIISSQVNNAGSGKRVSVFVRAEQASSAATSASSSVSSQDGMARRQLLAFGACSPGILLFSETPISFAAESKKDFLSVTDKKDGYSFLYPFGWQEVIIEGQDKVFKDVIEPLESVSVNIFPTGKKDIREFGPPEQVAETLIKKVLAPPSQKTTLIQAKEQDVDGRAYYTFEFTAQASNYTRHALSAICVGNGKFYTLTTGANQRRWDKMKDRLFTVVDSFRVFNV
uniref:PsbP C-terminal domain-containing protein n=1 Tax=Opuntia streptacantha TaxID=393608 RepID=A0A7C8ZYL7_OPUST